MPVPDYQTLMRPVLGFVLNNETKALEVIDKIAAQLDLTDEEREERLPSGQTTVLSSRVHWAIFQHSGKRPNRTDPIYRGGLGAWAGADKTCIQAAYPANVAPSFKNGLCL